MKIQKVNIKTYLNVIQSEGDINFLDCNTGDDANVQVDLTDNTNSLNVDAVKKNKKVKTI